MGGLNVKNTMVEVLMEKVAPYPCFGCGKIGTVLCENCKYNITSESFSGCILCGKVAPEGVCVRHDTTICKAWVVSQRVTVLKRVIDAYKFEYAKAAAHTLVDLIDTTLPLLPANTVVVPVPTAPSHIRQRGYNHLDILARLLSERRGLPIVRLLERSSVKSQHQLNKVERQDEASHAFRVADGIEVPPDTPLLVLDDIITTGSTVSSVANILAKSGAQTIFVAALAYQPLD